MAHTASPRRRDRAPDKRRRRVDRHRGIDLAERNAVEERLHIAPMADRDTRLPDLTRRDGSVGVVAILGRKVESDREAALALLEVAQETAVRLARVTKPRIGSDNPRLSRGFRTALASAGFVGHSYLRAQG